MGDKNSLKRTYDSFFQKKANEDIANLTGQQTVSIFYNISSNKNTIQMQ